MPPKKELIEALPPEKIAYLDRSAENTWTRYFPNSKLLSLDMISASLVQVMDRPAIAFACPACHEERQFMFLNLASKTPFGVRFGHSVGSSKEQGGLTVKHWRHIVAHPSFQMHQYADEKNYTCKCYLHICFVNNKWIFAGYDNKSIQLPDPITKANQLHQAGQKIPSFNYFEAPNQYPVEELRTEISMSLDIPNLLRMRENMTTKYKRKLSPLITKKVLQLKENPLLQEAIV